MLKSKIQNLIYNKNNFIKLIIICILSFIIYLLYKRINKINEGFVITTPATALSKSATYVMNETGTWTVPPGFTKATFTVISGKGGNNYNYDLMLGGSGSIVTTTLNGLNPGSTFYINVGSNGGHPDSSTGGFGGGTNRTDSAGIYYGSSPYMGGDGDWDSGGGASASYVSYNNM